MNSNHVSKLIKSAFFGVCIGLGSVSTGQAQNLAELHEARIGTRNDFGGMVGGLFMAGTTNVLVSHLGFYDQDADGLAASHNVGLFTGDGSSLLVSVQVPAGAAAPLTNGYRWAALDIPYMLRAGSNYIIAAEIGTSDGDLWSDQFSPTNWSPVFVGGRSGSTRGARWSTLPWPNAPLNTAAGNSIYGAPNLAEWAVGPARVVVVESQVLAYSGFPATLSTLANGAATLSFQWYKAPGTLLSGKTDSSLVIPTASSDDTGTYYVIASNSQGSMQSSNIVLTVAADLPVNVVSPPTNTSALELFSVSFYVSATGTPPISYQWQRNGLAIPGETNASFTLAAVSLTNNGDKFSCVLSNLANSTPNAITSGTGTLAVIANKAIPAQFFHETKNGTRDDVTGSVGNYFQVGENDAFVTHLGFYDRNGDGLTTAHHVGIFSADGSSLSGEVLVPAGTGADLINGYRWVPLSSPLVLSNRTYYLLGAEVYSGDGDPWADVNVPSSWNPLFVGTNGAPTRFATYTGDTWPAPPLSGIGAGWAVNGTFGAANLAILPSGKPMAMVNPTSVTQYQGFQATFDALVSGQPPVGIQWYKSPSTLLGGRTGSTLALSNLALSDSGNYYPVVTNAAGTRTATAVSLTVLPPITPQIIQDLSSQVTYLHQNVQLAVIASGPPPLTYVWKFNGSPIANQTNNALILTTIAPAQAGNYQVVISNGNGSTNSAIAAVSVVVPPAGSYAAGVLEHFPLAYYRFTEDPSLGSTTANLGTLGASKSATYEGGCYANAGAQPPAFPNFESTNASVGLNGYDSDASIPALNVDAYSGNHFTLAAWVNLNGLQWPYSGLVYERGLTEGASGLAVRPDWTGTSNLLMYSWADAYWQFDTTLIIPENTWTFIALTVEPNRAVVYADDGTGLKSSTNAASHQPISFGSPTYVGWDNWGGPNMRRILGAVDEVMLFGRALSNQEIVLLSQGLPPLVLKITASGASGLILTWSAGTLQMAPEAAGPYTDLTSATSPYTNSAAGPRQFFRVKAN